MAFKAKLDCVKDVAKITINVFFIHELSCYNKLFWGRELYQIIFQYVKTTFKAETIFLKDVSKVEMNILYLIKFSLESFIIELKSKMLTGHSEL